MMNEETRRAAAALDRNRRLIEAGAICEALEYRPAKDLPAAPAPVQAPSKGERVEPAYALCRKRKRLNNRNEKGVRVRRATRRHKKPIAASRLPDVVAALNAYLSGARGAASR